MAITAASGVAGDVHSIDALRAAAARDPKAALREAARQFEALFMQELMKSMRATTLDSGLVENGGSRLGTELLDAQFATQLTGAPGGLADAIARQLERQMGGGDAKPLPAAATPVAAQREPRIPDHNAAAFVSRHEAAAREVQAATGIPAHFMIGQAAHESGWGAREIRHADGSPSHNLFGIKAGPGWSGNVAEVTTTEYVDGEPRKVTAKFRAYASYEQSFRDYARLIAESPRYRDALHSARAAGSNGNAIGSNSNANGNDSSAGASDFANALQRAGYASDPAYADKLSRVINTTLRLARAAA